MRVIGSVIEKLQRHPKRIVFPEGAEPRVIQAARQFCALKLGVPILLGDRARIAEAAETLNISLEGIRVHKLAVREVPRSGKAEQLLEHYGISAAKIAAKVLAL